MFKSFFLSLTLCIIVNFAIAEDIKEDKIELSSVQIQNTAEKFMSFEVKKSEVFEDFSKKLSADSNADLQAFIESIEKKLSTHSDFIGIINQYSDLFKKMNIVKNNVPKVTMTFSFDKETWSNLVTTQDLNVDVLKNLLSEEQMSKLILDLKMIIDSMEKITFEAVSEIEKKLNLIREFKEKSGNQILRIGFILS